MEKPFHFENNSFKLNQTNIKLALNNNIYHLTNRKYYKRIRYQHYLGYIKKLSILTCKQFGKINSQEVEDKSKSSILACLTLQSKLQLKFQMCTVYNLKVFWENLQYIFIGVNIYHMFNVPKHLKNHMLIIVEQLFCCQNQCQSEISSFEDSWLK